LSDRNIDLAVIRPKPLRQSTQPIRYP